ncbi:MAG: Conjugative transfer protein TrbJ [Bryobacterales bacterium]|jgi:P-type conjugative transfer protein TrbJ|nr:Conjugative transfer protein TrbJ [Bryobacterales bacterium]
MKRLLLATVLVIPAYAQFLGVGNATEWTQIANNLQLVGMSAKQIQQLNTAIQTYQEALRAGRVLSNMQWRSAQQDLLNVAQITALGQGLSYSMADIDRQFRQSYPGFTPSAGPFFQQYQKWSQTALDTIQGSLRGSGLSYQTLKNEQQYTAYLQAQSSTSAGQMQAIQVGHQISIQNVNAMNHLRQLMLTDMQSKQAFQAYQLQKDMSQQQFEQKFFAPSKAGRDGIGW